MEKLIKKVLLEHVSLLNEMATKDWCRGIKDSFMPTYEFCKAAETYIKTELEDESPGFRKRKRKKVFQDFEKALQKFFVKNMGDEELKKRILRIEKTNPIFIQGEKEIVEAGNLLKNNCRNYSDVVKYKLDEFDNQVKLYFINEEGGYSSENRLSTNYSALANLFTLFFKEKGAFDGVHSKDHDWDAIAKNWISHSFHPRIEFNDIRPESEKVEYELSSLDFQELAKIYFIGNSSAFNSRGLKKSVDQVLEGVRGQGFATEDEFEKRVLKGKKEYLRFAKDYGFVDMFAGIDFVYKANDGMWIPVQVKTTKKEPNYLITKLGCKRYVIAEKNGDTFNFTTNTELPD